MDNNNSKSDSYVVREAENIIDNYLKSREESDIKKFNKLKEKYERMKILTIALFIVFSIGTILDIWLN